MAQSTFSFPTNDSDENPFRLVVTATVGAASSLVEVYNEGTLVRNGTSAAFGETIIGRSVERRFTIANRGTSNISVGTIVIDGIGFEISQQVSTTSIRPGRSARFRVEMTALTDTPQPSGRVRIALVGANIASYEFDAVGAVELARPMPIVTLDGTALPDGASVNFGSALTTSPLRRVVRIDNSDGTGPVRVQSFALTNTVGTAFSADGTFEGVEVPAGGTRSITVQLGSSTAVLDARARLQFSYNPEIAGVSNPFELNFSGTVSAPPMVPVIRVTTESGGTVRVLDDCPNPTGPCTGSRRVELEPFVVNSNTTQTFTIGNRGTANLVVSNFALVQTGSAFTFNPPAPGGMTTIAPGAANDITVTVRATSATAGNLTAFMRFDTNLPTTPFNLLLETDAEAALPILTIRDLVNTIVRPLNGPIMLQNFTQLGTTSVGTALQRSYTLDADSGNAPVTITSVTVTESPGDFAVTSAPVGPNNVATPGDDPRLSTTLRLTGATAGDVLGTVRVAHSGSAPAPADFRVYGSVLNAFAVGAGVNNTVRAIITDQSVGQFGQPGFIRGDFIAGDFTTPGAGVASFVPGTGLAALAGGGISGGAARVNALQVFRAPGSSVDRLYVAGSFTTAGGTVTAGNIASWDGTTWRALGSGVNEGTNGEVFAMARFRGRGTDEHLFIAGNFTTAGGSSRASIARWNGTTWVGLTLPPVSGGEIRALRVFQDPTGTALYAGGSFTQAGPNGQTALIARWFDRNDTDTWQNLGAGLFVGTRVNALLAFDTQGNGTQDLYIGGLFTAVGNVLGVNNIVSFRNNAVTPLALGLGGEVSALAGFDEDGNPQASAGGTTVNLTSSIPLLFAGGSFTTLGNGATIGNGRIARYTASTQSWSAVKNGVDNGTVLALSGFNATVGTTNVQRRLMVGGSFSAISGVAIPSLALWGIAVP